MAPIKFEENIKEKLEKRQIQPSSSAWDKLSAQLDEDDNKPSRNKYWWLGIAASFVGVLLISVWLINNTEDSKEPILVEETIELNNTILKDNSEVLTEEQTSQQIETPKNEATREQTNVVKKQNSKIKQELVSTNNKVQEKQTKANLNKALEDTKNTSSNTIANITQSEDDNAIVTTNKSITDIKVEQVVAQIQELNQANNGVTNAEIDSLLKEAQKSIMSQRLYNASTKTVSAEELLLEVEADSESSFRNRVFEALKSSYAKVKTAVVERNN